MSNFDDPETIVAAAIWYKGICYSEPAPARHYDVIRRMAAQGLADDPNYCRHQGFVTSSGRFVKRMEARTIAEAAGQLGKGQKTHYTSDLFSEDVW